MCASNSADNVQESIVYVYSFKQKGMQEIHRENMIYHHIHVQEETMFLANKEIVRTISFKNLGVAFYEAV